MKKLFLLLLLLAAPAWGQITSSPAPGVILQDEGSSLGHVPNLNCAGSLIKCTKSGNVGVITVDGSGTWTGSPIAIAVGGTAATTAAGARTNLGLVIGTNVLAPTGSAALLTNFPTLNQSTTGTSSGLNTNPVICAAGFVPRGIVANGDATGCAALSASSIVFQANGTPLISTSTINFLSGTAITISNPSAGGVQATLNNTAITAATYGDATHVAQCTFDAQGRATGCSNVVITAGTITGSGTTNTVTKWTASTGVGNSALTDDGTTLAYGSGSTGTFKGGDFVFTAEAAPGTPSSGLADCYVDSTTKAFSCKNDAGAIAQAVVGIANPSDSQFVKYIGVDGVPVRGTPAGAGTVTSVAQSFTGGLISVGGSPITDSGTLALTVAGTSGGIPYFSGASTWASSGALTLNGVVIGGGAGGTPTSTTAGTTGFVLTSNGSGSPPTFQAVAGTGTVTSVGWTGGIVSIATATSTPAFTIAGTSGGIPYFSGATTWASSAALTQHGVMIGGGAGAAPTSTAAGTSGQSFISNGAADPTWQSIRRTCSIVIGADNGSALADADIGPQGDQCFIATAGTLLEITVTADGGTPNVIPRRDRLGTKVNLVSSALATASTGAQACSKTGATTGIDGATTCSATLQNTSLSAGDWLDVASGTAGGTAKRMSIALTYTIP